jgi:hypothetical protein
MESRRCGTSPYCGMARAPTDCPRPTSNFWRASITCSEQVGLIDLCSGDGTRFAVWMMLYPCSLMLVRRAAVTATLYALIVMLMVPTRAPTMELKVVGTQLILSGPVVGDEPGKVREALASSPGIDTVILRNSGGGDAPAGYQVGQLLRERGLRTAVSGYCYSSCSRMFLGGSARYFTDDYLPENNNVGFHGHYDRTGHLNANLVRQYGLRDWIIKYSDGKADSAGSISRPVAG